MSLTNTLLYNKRHQPVNGRIPEPIADTRQIGRQKVEGCDIVLDVSR